MTVSSLRGSVPASVLDPSDILTTAELAARLKVPKSWVYNRTRAGHPMPHFVIGKYHRYSWAEVNEWMRKHHKRAA